MRKNELGPLEQVVMAAVALTGKEAYGVAVHKKVKELGQPKVFLPAVYITLERLEQKGFLKARMADPTPEAGGRGKKFFQITAAGELAMNQAEADQRRVFEGWKKWAKHRA